MTSPYCHIKCDSFYSFDGCVCLVPSVYSTTRSPSISLVLSLSILFEFSSSICNVSSGFDNKIIILFITFDRTHTIYVVFQFRGFYGVPRALIVDARSFQAVAAILD